ncbi:MAG: hypothetical protein A3B23_01125 [Candidatus Colwellbacteria bacterium RIFCSPLOWO2_01_FULL_48_10]|uniref:Transcriptional repressor PaaX-like central Cas2-like domain-containing protein n=1 Tax=Candidatus Colwellbacteria bacterium RIFCSPLOWO2_01_FULL_48_10 TaxID=1797690 RepID=A0A1G1Z4J2_9BACT|nr:MAG: hypothetical protein A3B23_01125 [Candidatus Colwellbacteria bacterium RIFCSPLOWO2_01_FULL_48_10]
MIVGLISVNTKINTDRFRVPDKPRAGKIGKKIMLLLLGGLALGLSGRPDRYFKILGGITKEWKSLDNDGLHESIKRLYQSKIIAYTDNSDGTIALVLTEKGKRLALRYNLDHMKISKPDHWDGMWRVVIFDIPEKYRQGRGELGGKLIQLGFKPIQKSVFIFPYECKNEIEFIIEVFNLRPYVRQLLVKGIDIDIELRRYFRLK